MIGKLARPCLAALLPIVVIVGCAQKNDDQETARITDVNNQPPPKSATSMIEIDSGYRSDQRAWQEFLSCWIAKNVELRSTPGALRYQREGEYSPTALASLESQAAQRNVAAIDEAEKRLGIKLPNSYRHFASLTGGYWYLDTVGPRYLASLAPPSHFLPLERIDNFKVVDNENWRVWNQARTGEVVPADIYYRYDKLDGTGDQDRARFRETALDALIEVGRLEQGAVILLNPQERTSDGEWEAWFLAPQLAGAVRTRSFAELMQYLALTEVMDVSPTPQLIARSCVAVLQTAGNP